MPSRFLDGNLDLLKVSFVMAATGKKQGIEDKGLGTKRHVRRRKPRAFWEVLLTLDTTGNPSSRFENEDELAEHL